jgi:hypothetical protein
MSKLEVLIPEGYMNVGINIEGTVLFTDNNQSEYYNIIRFKLPTNKKWELYSMKDNIATLKEKMPDIDQN